MFLIDLGFQPGTIGSKKLKDFERFKGEKIKINRRSPIEERKNFNGILQGARKRLNSNRIQQSFSEIVR